MSICVSVKARDGVVLGTDSMAQVWMRDPSGQVGVAKTYSNARKLFQLGDLPVGVMSYGAANVGDRSIEGLLREFPVKRARSIRTTADNLLEFVETVYSDAFKAAPDEQKPVVGFFVAGYSPNRRFPEEWEFVLPRDDKVKEVRPKGLFGASWRGDTLPFTRLYFGFDPRMRQLLEEMSVSEDVRRAVFDENRFKTVIPYNAMPVQDAINFADFVLRTTIGYVSFQAGVPTCGGPLQVAVILPETGFQWVAEPKFTLGGQFYG